MNTIDRVKSRDLRDKNIYVAFISEILCAMEQNSLH